MTLEERLNKLFKEYDRLGSGPSDAGRGGYIEEEEDEDKPKKNKKQ